MIISKSFSHISYTLEDDEYSKLALKMLSNSASISIIKPVSSKANGAKNISILQNRIAQTGDPILDNQSW